MLIKKIEPKILHWTNHSKAKMAFYRLAESRIKRIMDFPKRIEEGVAPHTTAMMQSSGSKKHPYEIWVMIEETPSKKKIISAWRYPGITKAKAQTTIDFLKTEYWEYSKTKK